MRRHAIIVVCLAVLIGLLTPSLAYAKATPGYTNKAACRRMTKQITHFESHVLSLAKARGNQLWENSTQAHVDRLKEKRADRCPEWAKQRSALQRAKAQAEQMAKMVQLGAKMAMTYFTGGLGKFGALF
jgi:hypothetical protein